MENCINCPFKKELDELKLTVKILGDQMTEIKLENAVSKEQMKTIFNTLNKIDKGMEKIQESIEKIDKNFDPEAIKNLKTDVQALKEKPAKKFEAWIAAVITAVSTTAAIMILNYITKK